MTIIYYLLKMVMFILYYLYSNIKNEKDGHQTFIYKLLLARTGINPKKNAAIGELAKNIEIAIEQEKKINEDIHQCKGQITCNIGRIIDEIRKDDGR